MSYDYDAPDTLETGSEMLGEPGTYQFLVTEIYGGLMPDGKTLLQDGGFSVNLEVLAGTVAGQQGKPCNLIFGNPRADAKPKAKEMAQAKKGAFFIATDLMTPAQLGAKGLKIELDLAKGRQVIATVERDSREGKEKYMQLSYACIYHVDDPRAAAFPKAPDALALMPKQLRHDAAYFAKLFEKNSAPTSSAAPVRPQLTQSQLAEL